MTAHSPLVCRRCGYTNVPGDQFCGSCGAFLEWEGEAVAGGQPPAGTAPDVPVVPPDAGGWPRPPEVVPGTGSTPPTVPTPAEWAQPGSGATPAADDGLIRCPACGIANAASRTFCQACGTRLADAGRVADPSREQIAAAVNAPNRPVPVTTTTIRPARAEPGAGGSSGDVLKWIAIMGVLGLVVGVGIVLAGNLLRGDRPSSGATSGPSASGVAVVSPGASGEPSGSAVAPTDAPTAPPTTAPRPVRLDLLGASASSVVGDLDKFAPGRAIDGDAATCWQEGRATEKGEWIEVVFAPSRVTALVITNGYNASRPLYRGNRRLKDVEIRVGDAEPVKVRLEDTGDPQRVNVPNVSGAVAVRITILSTYPSVETSVAGTPFDDAALGEIEVLGIPGS